MYQKTESSSRDSDNPRHRDKRAPYHTPAVTSLPAAPARAAAGPVERARSEPRPTRLRSYR